MPDDEDADENYQNTTMYVSKNGSTIAIRDNGDIISVCGNNEGEKDSSGGLLAFAVSKGGDRLDSFDGNHCFYRYCGFEPVTRIDFVEDFAPPNWVKGRDKPEPIIFYKYTGFKTDLVIPKDVYNTIPSSTEDNAYDDVHSCFE